MDVSTAAREATEAKHVRLNRIRAEIEAGTYLTTDRISGAVDRLLASLDD